MMHADKRPSLLQRTLAVFIVLACVTVIDASGHTAPWIALLEDATGHFDDLAGRKLGGRHILRGKLAPGEQAEQPAIARRQLTGGTQCVATRYGLLLFLRAASRDSFHDRLTLRRADGVCPTIDIHHVMLA